MTGAISIENMTVEEKILTMESLWDDLCARAGDDLSPSWHESVLKEREQEYGESDPFLDWDMVKKKIRDDIS